MQYFMSGRKCNISIKYPIAHINFNKQVQMERAAWSIVFNTPTYLYTSTTYIKQQQLLNISCTVMACMPFA